MAFCCEKDLLLRNRLSSAKIKTTLDIPLFFYKNRSFELPKGFRKEEHQSNCLFALSPEPEAARATDHFLQSAMAQTKGAKSSFPYGRKGIVREALVQGSTSEPPLQVAAPPPAEPASLSHLARRYQTRSGGRPPQKKTRVVDPDPSLEPSLALSLEPLAEPQPSQPPLVESQIPSGIAPEVLIRRPMVPQPPIEGNLDCQARPFHSELCFDTATFRFQPELADSFRLLHRYRMEHLLTLRDFFYPRVAMDFY